MKKEVFFILSFISSLLFYSTSFSQEESLQATIGNIISTSKAEVGVGIMAIEDRESLVVNDSIAYPMQSVYKFPLAMAVLALVDQGKLSLAQKVLIKKEDLHPTYSPMGDKYPEGNVFLTISDLLRYSVSLSDNNACDILFRLAGGTQAVDRYIHSLGIKEIAIKATEHEMSEAWDVQFTNWCRPAAMLTLLTNFYKGQYLSKSSNKFLWQIMVESPTGPNRLKGLLPANTIVAHKTGTSSTNEKGIPGATNDAGIIKLPNGKHLAIVIFVKNSPEDETFRDGIIARIAKSAYDYYAR